MEIRAIPKKHGHKHGMEHGNTTFLLAPLMGVAAQALCMTMPCLSMSRAQKPSTKYFPSSLGPMNPVTSHLDAFELHDFFFFFK